MRTPFIRSRRPIHHDLITRSEVCGWSTHNNSSESPTHWVPIRGDSFTVVTGGFPKFQWRITTPGPLRNLLQTPQCLIDSLGARKRLNQIGRNNRNVRTLLHAVVVLPTNARQKIKIQTLRSGSGPADFVMRSITKLPI
jgi:hypothetical protein